MLIQGIFARNTTQDEVAQRIRSVWPKLSISWLGARMEEVARSGLPRWMDQTFWTAQVDAGHSGTEFAALFDHSNEYFATIIIGPAYERYLRRGADPARLATATLAAIQGGLVLTQTRRDPRQLRIALDAAYAYLRSFATDQPNRKRAPLTLS